MARIKPFRGVRYNSERFDDMSVVVSQPYDRVRYRLQDRYYALSDCNIVRIIRNKEQPGDEKANNVYTRARDTYDRWLRDGVLAREEQPALYVFHQTFATPGGETSTSSVGATRTRKAFICALELTAFDEGVVLPHERTHAGPKVDRLNLLRATEVNFGLIFMVYPDQGNKVNALLDAAVAGRQPDVDVVELFEKDVRQQMWAVTDPQVIAAVRAEMAPKRNLIIADGHHRYETAINYRNEMRALHPDAPADAAFNYRMVTLVSMDDPGLTILPTHREIYGYEEMRPDEMLQRAAEYFTVTPMASKDACLAAMAEHQAEHAIGFYAGGPYYMLVLKNEALLDQLIPEDRTVVWKSLDVSILHRILLEQVVGISGEVIDAKDKVRYHRDPQLPIDAVDAGEANFVFFLNPTLMMQVKTCTEMGEKMPAKSTDFYPKAISGLVMCPVGAGERLA
jgi:uncharacterized protein (DUF1015 family)